METYQSTRIPVYLVSAMFFCYLLDQYLLNKAGFSLSAYGIYPRQLMGLLGILTTPFIHGNGQHLLSNSIPLLILGTALYLFYPKSANRVLLWVYLGSGLGIWLFGRAASFHGSELVHIGSSGVVYGLAAFLVVTGMVRRQAKAIAVAASVYFLYSGMLSGLFPSHEGVSWEGHLSGAIVGLWLAFSLRGIDKEPNKPKLAPAAQDRTGFQNLQTKVWKYTFIEKKTNSN